MVDDKHDDDRDDDQGEDAGADEAVASSGEGGDVSGDGDGAGEDAAAGGDEDGGADVGDADDEEADDEEADDEEAVDEDGDEDEGDDEAPEAVPAKKGSKRSGFGSMIGLVGFLLALGGGFLVGQWINSDDPYAEIEQGPRLKVKLRGDEPQVGPDDALVTIIEFADYQCPYCQQASPELMKALDKFEGKVRLIYKHLPLPFHRAALPASKAAWAAGQQDKFWEFHEAMFVSKASLEGLDALVQKHGLDADKFQTDMQSPEAAKQIDDDMKAAAVLGITGTPAFVVNGHHYRGKRTYSQWKQILDAEIDAAEEVVSQGVAPGDVYEHLMKDALEKRSPPPSPGSGDGPDPNERYQVKPDGRPGMGPEDALVTIVEFSDFQCPYCSKMAPVAHAIVENNDDVRFVFRNLPLGMHKQARPAAIAALAAGRQGKYWEAHDKLFAEQKELPDHVGDDFEDWADELGLDVDQFKTDYADPALAKEVDEDVKVARRFAVRGTPGAFVNGKFVNGAVGVDALQAVVDTERKVAQKLVADGTAKEDVLDVLLRDALQRVMKKKVRKGKQGS